MVMAAPKLPAKRDQPPETSFAIAIWFCDVHMVGRSFSIHDEPLSHLRLLGSHLLLAGVAFLLFYAEFAIIVVLLWICISLNH